MRQNSAPERCACSRARSRFVVVGVIERQRERAERPRRQARREAEHGARIDAAAQIAGDRHVGAQPQPDRFLERVLEPLDPLARRRRPTAVSSARGIVPVPVRDDANLLAVGQQVARRRELVDAREQRAIGRMRHEMHVVERVAIPAQRHAERGERLDLRGEIERAVVDRVVERLDAEAVARREELAVARVPDGEGELAAQRVQRARAAILVEVQRDLAVGSRAEDVALAARAPRGCARSRRARRWRRSAAGRPRWRSADRRSRGR